MEGYKMNFQYELVLKETFFPENEGRAYHSERVVQRFEDKRVAEGFANSYNKEALPNQYYSIREVEGDASYDEDNYAEPSEATEWADFDPDC